LLFLATNQIGIRIYRLIPDAYGGGKPVSAQLLLNYDGVVFWKQTGAIVPNDKDSVSSGPIKILYQSEHELVIEAPSSDGPQTKEKIIRLKTELVDGILPVR
jgi:hypothetical protein